MNIRQELRNKINNDDLSDFFNFLMNEQSISYINEFMKDVHDNNIDDGYLYIMSLLYNEDISYVQLPQIVQIYKTYIGNKDDFGKAVLDNFKNIHIRDKIINIYTGRGDILSYKDIDNIKDNAKIIYSSLTENEKNDYLNLPGAIDDSYEFIKYFARINNSSATIESYIDYYSYIYNKKMAIYMHANNNAGYQLNSNEFENISDSDFDRIKNIIDNFYSKIMSGTIYY